MWIPGGVGLGGCGRGALLVQGRRADNVTSTAAAAVSSPEEHRCFLCAPHPAALQDSTSEGGSIVAQGTAEWVCSQQARRRTIGERLPFFMPWFVCGWVGLVCRVMVKEAGAGKRSLPSLPPAALPGRGQPAWAACCTSGGMIHTAPPDPYGASLVVPTGFTMPCSRPSRLTHTSAFHLSAFIVCRPDGVHQFHDDLRLAGHV